MTQIFLQTLGPNQRVLDAIKRGKPAVVKVALFSNEKQNAGIYHVT